MADLSILPHQQFKYDKAGIANLQSYLKRLSRDQSFQIAELLRTDPLETIEYVFALSEKQRALLRSGDVNGLKETVALIIDALTDSAAGNIAHIQENLQLAARPTDIVNFNNRVGEISWKFVEVSNSRELSVDPTRRLQLMRMNIGIQYGRPHEVDTPEVGVRFEFSYGGSTRAIACGSF